MRPKMFKKNKSPIYLCSFYCLLIFLFSFLAGCSVIAFLTPEGPPSDRQLLENYQSIQLMTSNAADVLVTINLPEYELLSQSRSVIASAGEKKKGYKQWMNMVAFDEDTLTAKRKYLLIVDERPKALFAKPWERLTFNCQVVLDEQILNQPYANENAFRIEMLTQISNLFTEDTKEVSLDNDIVYTSQLLVKQAFSTILQRLQDTPAQASLLSTSDGMQFEHISFDKGRIRMITDQNIAAIEIQLGSLLKKRLETTDKGLGLEYKSGDE